MISDCGLNIAETIRKKDLKNLGMYPRVFDDCFLNKLFRYDSVSSLASLHSSFNQWTETPSCLARIIYQFELR